VKRWLFIHADGCKFQGSFEAVKRRVMSGVSTVDKVKTLHLFSMFIAHMWVCIIDCFSCV
jgi:hypothetical protein